MNLKRDVFMMGIHFNHDVLSGKEFGDHPRKRGGIHAEKNISMESSEPLIVGILIGCVEMQ